MLPTGEFGVSVLDARGRIGAVGRPGSHDPPMYAPATDLHARPAHAQSRLRTLSRLQGNSTGERDFFSRFLRDSQFFQVQLLFCLQGILIPISIPIRKMGEVTIVSCVDSFFQNFLVEIRLQVTSITVN